MTTTVFVTLVHLECYKCHVCFGMTDAHYRQVKEHGDEFFCPNGHGQVFRPTELDRLRKQAADLERSLSYQRNVSEQARADADAERGRRIAYQGVATRRKKLMDRTKNGVCMYCNRLFVNLQRHMKTKHNCVGTGAEPM